MKQSILLGVLLSAAPLFSQHSTPKSTTKRSVAPLAEPIVKTGQVRWFTLDETPKQIAAALGEPAMVAESGANWIAWQYRIGDDVEHEDFSHQLLLERGTGRLLAVTRNYGNERDVSALFPERETSRHYFPDEKAPQLTVRVRKLPDGRVLTALGANGPTAQLALLRPEMLSELFPWMALGQ